MWTRLIALVATTAMAGTATADELLPAGEGRELVIERCGNCHGLDEILEGAGMSREDWDDMVYEMSALARRKPELRDALVDYLAEHFPPRAAQAAGR